MRLTDREKKILKMAQGWVKAHEFRNAGGKLTGKNQRLAEGCIPATVADGLRRTGKRSVSSFLRPPKGLGIREGEMDMLEFMLSLHEVCKFQTREGKLVDTASKSEIRRWFQRNAVHVNGRPVKAEDSTPETWISLVLFPKSRPVTLW